MKNLALYSFLLFSIGSKIFSQDIPIHTWRTHFCYTSAQNVIEYDNKVFCATYNGFFVYNTIEKSAEILDHNTGLSDVGITSLAKYQNKIIIAYYTGSIDILSDGDLITISTLKDVENNEQKAIYQILVTNNIAYLATDLGLALFEFNTNEIRDIYQEIGTNGEKVNVYKVAIIRSLIYIISSQGVMYGNLENNLLDYANWKTIVHSDTSNFNQLVVNKETLWLSNSENEIWKYENNVLEKVLTFDKNITLLKSINNVLYIVTNQQIYKFDNLQPLLNESYTSIQDFDIQGNQIFLADNKQGLIILSENQTKENIIPNGVSSDNITRIHKAGQSIFATYGDINKLIDQGLDEFKENIWTNHRNENFNNVTSVANFQNKIILGTSNGLYDFSNQQPISSIQAKKITDLTVANDKLWISTKDTASSLHFTKDLENWTSIDSKATKLIYPLEIKPSIHGILWIKQGNTENYGLKVFAQEENYIKEYKVSQGLPNNIINDFIIDTNNKIWVATPSGLAIYYDATFAFGDDYFFEETVFSEGNLSSKDNFTAIALDGGNRKWLGTTKGLWLYENDLTVQIFHFTEKNSPLPSNNIQKLVFNDVNGELFILTDRGLVSFQTNSIKGLSSNGTIKIFPNPISLSSGYEISFQNMVDNAMIKITDINGKLIKNLQSVGSAISWNLRQMDNSKVPVGIYLIFSSLENGDERYVGKFAVIP